MSVCFEVQVLSPRMICPCGRSVRVMTEEEHEKYGHALRRIADERAKDTYVATEASADTDASPDVRASRHADWETSD